MLLFAKAMGRLSSSKYEGTRIGKITYRRLVSDTKIEEKKPAEAEFLAFEEKKNAFISIICIQKKNGQELAEDMKVIVIFKKKDIPKAVILSEESKEKWKPFRSFEEEEIYEFSRKVNDINSIHLSNQPVVQGMLLFEKLMQWRGYPGSAEVKFIKPVLAGNMVYLKERVGIIEGFSDNELCFQMNFHSFIP